MKKIFLFAPQWQDSGLTDELYCGALALRKYYKSVSDKYLTEIPIDKNSKPILENNIFGYSIIVGQLNQIKSKLESERPDKIFALGGGCGIEIPIVSYLFQENSNSVLFWFDAHGDLNNPDSSPSKHFHGMPLRFLTEKQNNSIGKTFNIIPHENIILVGTRDLDPPETDYINYHKIKLINENNSELLNRIEEVITENKSTAYVHIDLDVLDPHYYRNVKCPIKGGISLEILTEAINKIRYQMNLIGLSIVENTETDQSKIKLLNSLFEVGIEF